MAFNNNSPDCQLFYKTIYPKIMGNAPMTESQSSCSQSSFVTTDIQSRIYVVNLSNAGAKGVIPPEIGKLKSVKILKLGANALTGPIPEELGSLNEISTLDLSENQLTGPIPNGLKSRPFFYKFLFDKRNVDAGQTAVSSESSVSTQKTSTQTADTPLTTTISSSKTPSTTPASPTTPNILSDGTNFIMKYPFILIIIFGFTFVFVLAYRKRQRYMKAKKRSDTTQARPSATPLVQEIPIVAPPPSPKNDTNDYRLFVSSEQSSQPTLNNQNGGYSFYASSDKVTPTPFIRQPMPVHNPQDSKLYDVHLSILKKVEGHGAGGRKDSV
ncbi:hypothetical protein BC833DRAFT_626308 [Globomyces pollinis-pini]|nr:hypothetical protein BC833DRAFT_626308 [Globomyces pollinis-pini]